ncbi:leucine-rich repeat-containing protein 74B-like [Gigantopelta aegis]|uniref:leucine-rich repeat-containing protein 74B-like n=1 Tax=Gigantopelta aegis TaxID=1735272 RepID=UPI001B88D75E|nr:leucine-rich repeat-containing protein 74B-like [Gigantopelta aegis]
MDVAIQTVRFSDTEDAKIPTVSTLPLRPNLKKLVFKNPEKESKHSIVEESPVSFASSVTPDHELLQTARFTTGGRLSSSWTEGAQCTDETLITQIPESLFLNDQADDDIDGDIIQINNRAVRRNKAVSLSPVVSSDDDDYETDLEFDEELWLNPDRCYHDTTGKTGYLKACSDLGINPISYFLKHIQDTELTMKFHGLGLEGTKALSVPLETNTVIEKLNLEGNGINPAGGVFLSRILKENLYITDLILSENNLGSVGAIAVCDLLISNRNLYRVDLRGNGIDDSAAEMICKVLMTNTTLKHLGLAHNRLEEYGVKYFRDAIIENESLETLDLSWNHINTKGAIYLAEGLQENVRMKNFGMAMAGVGVSGAVAIGKAIKLNRTLQELDISFCRIPVDGEPYISSGLAENDVLRVLKIGFNPLDANAAMKLLEALDKNESSDMTCIDISNVIVKEDFIKLQKKLQETRGIRVISEGMVIGPLKQRKSFEEMVLFRQDPVGQLKKYIEESGQDFMDIFAHRNSKCVTKQEFRDVMKESNIDITEDQIDILMSKLSLFGRLDIGYLTEQLNKDQTTLDDFSDT